jgi:putative phage-type endonuclease
MRVIDCEQGSPEWHAARLGKVTASRIADLTAKTKTGWGASRANYAAELIAERLTGKAAERYTNAAMEWGTQHEAEARASYALMTGSVVTEVGIVLHPAIDMAAASPDGLVGDTGLLEVKCPSTSTHIDTLMTEVIEGKYVKQMLWQMICTGRKWCDFVSYDPRLPPEMQLFCKRVVFDATMAAELEAAVIEFLKEVDGTVDALTRKYLREAA